MAIKVSSPVGMRGSSEGWMQTAAVDSDLHKYTISILITMAEVIVSESEKCYLTPALTKKHKNYLSWMILSLLNTICHNSQTELSGSSLMNTF